MSITNVTSVGSAASVTPGQTSISKSPSPAIAVGKIAFAAVVKDNTSTVNGDNSEVTSVTDSQGNTWTKVMEYTKSSGAAADGTTASLWICNGVTVQIETTDSITAAFAACDARIIGLATCDVDAGNILQVAATTHYVGTSSTPTVTLSSLANKEYLFMPLLGSENNGTGGSYTNYTNLATGRANGGSGSTSQQILWAYRVLTGTGDSATSSAIVGDKVVLYVAFEEIAAITDYEVTVDSGSVVITGSDIGLSVSGGLGVAVDSGSVSISPSAVGIAVGRKVAVGSGSVTITGSSIEYELAVTAAPFSVVITGSEIGLSKAGTGSYSITVDSASILITGTDHTPVFGGRKVTVIPAAIVINSGSISVLGPRGGSGDGVSSLDDLINITGIN